MSGLIVGGLNETDARAIFAGQEKALPAYQMASMVIDTFLGGILSMQLYHYFTWQKNDKTWTKLIVVYVMLWNAVITIYYWIFSQYYFVQHFGEYVTFLEVGWLAKMPVFDGCIVSVVQGFFAYRAYLLHNRNILVLIVCGALILTALGGSMGLTIAFGREATLLGASNSGPTLITWLAATSAVDVLIAVLILWGLLRSKSGWAHTDRLVSRLIRLTFEAQLPPTCLAIAYLIEWCITPAGLLGALFQALQAKAYCIGLLFSLNARISFQAHGEGTVQQPQVFGMSQRGTTGGVQIEVETETYVHGGNYGNELGKNESLSDTEYNRNELGYDNGSKARLTPAPLAH